MAYNNILGNAETFVAGADLSTKQYLFVVSANGKTVNTVGTAGAAADGVLWNAPVSGDAATVVRGGEVNVYVGTGGLTAGQDVASDATGKAVAATTGQTIVGKARETVAAGGLAMITFYPKAQSAKA